IENNDKRINENTPLATFQSMIVQAEKALMEWPIYEQLQSEIIRLKREISSYEDRVEKICQDLNYSNESLSNVLNLNLGLDMKGKIKDSLHEKVTLSTRLDAVQLQINHSQDRKSVV